MRNIALSFDGKSGGAGRSDGCVALCTIWLKSRYKLSNSIPLAFGGHSSSENEGIGCLAVVGDRTRKCVVQPAVEGWDAHRSVQDAVRGRMCVWSRAARFEVPDTTRRDSPDPCEAQNGRVLYGEIFSQRGEIRFASTK